MDLFRVLGNENRRSMIKILMHKGMHISALAKELDISVPVALKHIKALESVGLVERSKLGNTHLIGISKAAIPRLKGVYSLFEEPLVVEAKAGTPLLDALKKVVPLGIQRTPDGAFISEVDGKQGYYIYEVDGKLSNVPVDRFLVDKGIEVEFKRLIPVIGKKVVVKV
jgi:DNA-binding transcriptional ArsR family regulator